MTTFAETIAELRKLHETATKAPWEATATGVWSPSDGCDVIHVQDESFMQDAALIVAMRNDLTTLLNHIDDLQDRIVELEHEVRYGND